MHPVVKIYFFKNQYDEPYAAIRIGNDRYMEIISLKQKNTKCRYWLTRLFRENTNGQIVGKDTINNAINALAANAIFDGKTIPFTFAGSMGKCKRTGVTLVVFIMIWRTVTGELSRYLIMAGEL